MNFPTLMITVKLMILEPRICQRVVFGGLHGSVTVAPPIRRFDTFRQFCPGTSCPRLVDLYLSKVSCFFEVRPAEVNTTEPGTAEVGVRKLSILQVGKDQVSVAQVSAFKVRVGQVREGQIGQA